MDSARFSRVWGCVLILRIGWKDFVICVWDFIPDTVEDFRVGVLIEIEWGSERENLLNQSVLLRVESDWKLIGEFHILIIHENHPKSSKCNGLQQTSGQSSNCPRAAWIFYIVSMCNDSRNMGVRSCTIREFKWITRMTVATPRKTRTRKVAARKVTPVKTPKKVTATVRKVKAVKVSAPRRPSSAKLITPSRYVQDIKARWAIHNYEITMLLQDLTKLNTYVRQFAKWPLRPHTGSFFVII